MNLSPTIQYGLVLLGILLVSGVLAYLRVVPNDMFLILFSAAVGHIAGVQLDLTSSTSAKPTSAPTPPAT